MTGKIIDSISKTIFDEFGTKYKIHTEAVEQGLKTPCFFINTGDITEIPMLVNRYLSYNPILIQYLSNSKDKKKDCLDVLDRLINRLEYVLLDDKDLIRGSNISGDYSDGILTFSINYDLFIFKTKKPVDKFSNYNLSNGVKG